MYERQRPEASHIGQYVAVLWWLVISIFNVKFTTVYNSNGCRQKHTIADEMLRVKRAF